MKKHLIFIIFILIAKFGSGQNWQWAKQIGGISRDAGIALIDANNNIYCSGTFINNCYFEHDTLHATGNNDMFFAKYDSAGNELWAKRIGSNNPYDSYEYGGVAAIDNDRACLYFTGTFYNTLNLGAHSVTSSGGADLFIAKFDLSGNCLWLKKAGSYGDDYTGALCLDGNGNIFFMGQLAHNGTFDTISLTAGTFLSKINPNANIIWARKEINRDGNSTKIKIVNNFIIMSGVTANSDTTIIDTTILVSTHKNMDGFIAQLDLYGNCIKAKRFIGHFWDSAGDFDLDTNNNIYVSGTFTDTISIDGTILIANNSHGDMFFCKFDSAFNLIWARQTNSTGNYGAIASGVIKDNEDKFYVSGYFGGNATFGNYNVTSSVTQDMFLARYTQDGECIGIIHFGEASANNFNIDSNGDIIVAGDFTNTVELGGTTLTSYGYSDMFFAKTGAIVGIDELKATNNNMLQIYANPTTGKCTVTVPDDFLNTQDLILSIFDNTGKIIQQRKLEMNEGKIKVDLEEEAKGIYNVTLGNGKKVYGGRIVFQ
jgi:hypothetical protein